MKNGLYVKPQGTSEGLALWWKEEVDVKIVKVTHNLIYCEIKLKNHNELMWITWVHENVDVNRRLPPWDELRTIRDFNDTRYHHEKEGGKRKAQRLIDAFKQMIEDIHMEDLGAKGKHSHGQTSREEMNRLMRYWTVFSLNFYGHKIS